MTAIVQPGRSTASYFRWSFLVSGVGMVLGAWIGWNETHSLAGTLSVAFIVFALSILEISLSFDNAIVNANRLKTMDPVWRRRFLTWGILIAVFGMRLVFPVAFVAIAARLAPWEAVAMAVGQPERYSQIMHDAHLPIAAFGGTFLLMVALKFFLNQEKDIHWLPGIESFAVRCAAVRGVEVALALGFILAFAALQPGHAAGLFLNSAVWGLLVFLMVDLLGLALDRRGQVARQAAAGGLGSFLYLEVIDASFSFDGVIGAFALSQHLFVIAIGLGVGAMYVRSMTMMLVERGTLVRYRFLEHGAFYAVLLLSLIMFVQTLVEIPEAITGLCGAALIAVAFLSSLRGRDCEVGQGEG